ncbi:SDR family oxidoreductase [Oceanicoccus sagamiensis]|uniref:dTDP-4-dehydrorhamnose reductase n=1 Tax=Oceanicoccus sagamiensis TaxID=716816 RepID=A0A1X9NF43_9GAMM|nr:sugar nucleotide-binding protein [Oceanicoccus sagamiensis]ARN74495.1 hypothetical protein BST96_10420 [Oceanicoccus sagamiensis]
MKVLIIALDHQIRNALEAQLDIRGREYESVGLEWIKHEGPVDVQNPPLRIPNDISVVVNALSLECLEQHLADEELIESLALVAQACEQAAIPILQLSNSQVFDGTEGGRYRETDEVVPVSRIGALLSRMEELLRGSCHRHIILRTGPLFSAVGDNLVTLLLAEFQQGETLRLCNGASSCPMHAQDLARVVSAIIDQLSCGCESWGTYHYCSSDPANEYQFAETVLAVASQYTQSSEHPLKLEPNESSESDWPRPLMNCEKILHTFGIKQLPWRAFVVPTVKTIFQPESTEDKTDEQ